MQNIKDINPNMINRIGFGEYFLCLNANNNAGFYIKDYTHYPVISEFKRKLRELGCIVKPSPFVKKNIQQWNWIVVCKNNVFAETDLWGNEISTTFFYNNGNLEKDRFQTENENMPYLAKKRIQLIITKLVEWAKGIFVSAKIEDRTQKKMTPKEQLMRLMNSWDIHKLPNGRRFETIEDCINDLNDCKDSIYNNKSKDGTILKNGQKKYFYEPLTKRLKCGIVFNAGNNSWAVLCPDGVDRVANFDLFDYNNHPFRKVDVEKTICYLTKKIDECTQEHDFKSVNKLLRTLEKLTR